MSPVVEIILRTIDQSKGDVGKLTSGLAKLATQYLSVGAVAAGAYKIIQDSIKTTLDYANSVRQLSAISGESTEETSRFIQVLDDYKITAADALTATRTLTREGHAPSIETLAKLSDEYLALNTAEEKNEFVLKNLGRGGLQWVEVLNKGSKALREQGDAVNQALILSQKQVDAARKNEIAVDNWNDSVQALKISLGNDLIPVMTGFVNGLNASARAEEIIRDKGHLVVLGNQEWTDALEQARKEQELATDAMLKNAEAADTFTGSLQLTEAELKDITAANQGMLDLIGNLQNAEDTYAERYKEVNADMSLTDEERRQQLAELAAEYDRTNKEIISGLVERKLMQDGVLDDKEFEWLLQKRQEWGLYSADVVEKARAAWKEADKITASIANIPANKTVTVTVQQIGGYNIGTTQYNNIAYAGRAGGGDMFAGIPYRVGERGPEVVVPGQNSTVIPDDKLGGNNFDYKRIGREMERAYLRAMNKRGG